MRHIKIFVAAQMHPMIDWSNTSAWDSADISEVDLFVCLECEVLTLTCWLGKDLQSEDLIDGSSHAC